MKSNNKAGFTLIEVLIALAVLSISMLGVYSLLNMSTDTLISAQDKMFVIERGYDRISKQINYPSKAYEEKEEYNGVMVNYSVTKDSVGIPGVQQVTLTVSTDKAQTSFIYYEKSSGSMGGF